MPKISIVVPIYNTDLAYLQECVRSLINQTLKDIEIVLVNDGSNKQVAEACDKYGQEDERIIVVHQENQGVSMARNNGIKITKSEWIMFVDADDWLEKNACKNMYNAIEKDVDVIISKCYIVNGKNISQKENKLQKDTTFSDEEKQKVVRGIFLDYDNIVSYVDVPWAKIYRKEIIEKNKIIFDKELKSGEDGLFNFEFYHFAKKIKYINEFIYYYRINSTSVTNKFRTNLVSNYTKLCEKYDKLFKELDTEYIGRPYINYFTIRKIDEYSKKYFFNPANKKSSKEVKKEFFQVMQNEPFKSAINDIDEKVLSKKRKYVLKACKQNKYYKIKLLYKINTIKNKIQ